MSTVIKPTLSERSEYWIPRHRYYELKHFCLQYPAWKKTLDSVNLMRSSSIIDISVKNSITDPTGEDAIILDFCKKRMGILETAAKQTDEKYWKYILTTVTKGYTYSLMSVKYDIFMSRDEHYKLYRRFFWILDKIRD